MVETESSEPDEKVGGRTPPYISFQTLKTMLASFKEHGVPGRIDRSILTNFSGGVANQLILSLRFLGLIDGANAPTETLADLVRAYGTDEWTDVLDSLLRSSYPQLFNLELSTATPSQFNEEFRKAFPSKDETMRKCMTFFLNAVREAKTPVSAYIMRNKKPRSNGSKSRSSANGPTNGGDSARKKVKPAAPGESSNGSGETPCSPKTKEPSQVLLSMLDPDEMSEEEIQAVWTLILYEKRRESQTAV